MIWRVDEVTRLAAQSFPLLIRASEPSTQDHGGNFNPTEWTYYLRLGDVFPTGLSKAGPDQIIAEFQAQHYLPALALTIRWGTMWRTKKYILRQHRLEDIHDTLDRCAESICRTQSIEQSWNFLTNDLQWTNVITSKTLHFLCRALGFNQDPPVPIDNKVILDRVWPAFRVGIPPERRPQDWSGNSFAAYSRYMTAIIEWGQIRNWTTTQVEATICEENW
jgi:hypothetical protein